MWKLSKQFSGCRATSHLAHRNWVRFLQNLQTPLLSVNLTRWPSLSKRISDKTASDVLLCLSWPLSCLIRVLLEDVFDHLSDETKKRNFFYFFLFRSHLLHLSIRDFQTNSRKSMSLGHVGSVQSPCLKHAHVQEPDID